MRIKLLSVHEITGNHEWSDLCCYGVKYSVKSREEAVNFLASIYLSALVQDTGDIIYLRVPGGFVDQYRVTD